MVFNVSDVIIKYSLILNLTLSRTGPRHTFANKTVSRFCELESRTSHCGEQDCFTPSRTGLLHTLANRTASHFGEQDSFTLSQTWISNLTLWRTGLLHTFANLNLEPHAFANRTASHFGEQDRLIHTLVNTTESDTEPRVPNWQGKGHWRGVIDF